jgi:hypothetical protein
MEHPNLSQGNLIADEVNIDLDVLHVTIVDRISGHTNGTNIVTVHEVTEAMGSVTPTTLGPLLVATTATPPAMAVAPVVAIGVATAAREKARARRAGMVALHSSAVVLLVLPSRPHPRAPGSATTHGHPSVLPQSSRATTPSILVSSTRLLKLTRPSCWCSLPRPLHCSQSPNRLPCGNKLASLSR